MADALLMTIGSPVSNSLEIFLLYFLPVLISTLIFGLIIAGFGNVSIFLPILVFFGLSLLGNFAIIGMYKHYDLVKRE